MKDWWICARLSVTKRSGIPVDILVLACLRLLGRYPHYNDLEEICKKIRNNERNENIQRRHNREIRPYEFYFSFSFIGLSLDNPDLLKAQ